MKKVTRDEILDYVTYSEERERIRREVLSEKERRRVHVGEHLTLLFENHATLSYQVQEMMRIERIVREADIQHEIDTYNEVLGDEGELGCTMLIEIDDPAARDVKLGQWLGLPRHVHAVLEDGTRVTASHDPRQVDEDRLSAVQFLRFRTEGRVPVAIEVDHPELAARAELTALQRAALAEDLA